MTSQPGVLRTGDRIQVDGVEHTVIALSGMLVRLRSATGEHSVYSLSGLLQLDGLELIDAGPRPALHNIGLLDSIPDDLRDRALFWERHVIEVETGLLPTPLDNESPKAMYNPAATTLAQREAAKAQELTSAGTPTSKATVHRMRIRYANQGVWGLVDQRRTAPRNTTGRADPRVVAAIVATLDAETNESTGTRDRLRRRVRARLDADFGPGVVPVPPRTSFHRLVNALSAGKHTFGSAVTRRQTANRPATPFTPTTACRPGELTEIDTTPLDVMAYIDHGVAERVELTMIVDVATRTIGAGILRPKGTRSVDAALLLAKALVPEPMRPGWSDSLSIARSALPHTRLSALDERLDRAAAKPVIAPDTIVCDRGRVYLSDNFVRACDRLGISLQPSRPHTPTNKPVVERTFESIGSLFAQHVAGFTGSNVTLRGRNVDESVTWTIAELQELFDEWVIAGWQNRPHDSLRDPYIPSRALSPNEMYAAMVAAAGFVPLPLNRDDYIELLPVQWRHVQSYGIKINHRTYDCDALDPYRGQPSGIGIKRNRWPIHYDPYDVRSVWLRSPEGWLRAEWTHLRMMDAPFAEFTWAHARELAADTGRDPNDQAAVAQALDDLLNRAGQPTPLDETSKTRRTRARTRAATEAPLHPLTPPGNGIEVGHDDDDLTGSDDGVGIPEGVLWGIFDPAEEAQQR